jgi:hypothetical protein
LEENTELLGCSVSQFSIHTSPTEVMLLCSVCVCGGKVHALSGCELKADLEKESGHVCPTDSLVTTVEFCDLGAPAHRNEAGGVRMRVGLGGCKTREQMSCPKGSAVTQTQLPASP